MGNYRLAPKAKADLEELMQERGYAVDHSTVQRWIVHCAPRIEKIFRKHKKRTGNRWRLDETYSKSKVTGDISSAPSTSKARLLISCSPEMILLHGLVKKTQKTPDRDLKLAQKRKKEYEKNG